MAADGRSVGTAIYFLVTAASPSRLHRVDAVEVFHWYAGDEVEQLIVTVEGSIEVRRIGPAFSRGAAPQAIVPAGAWQGLHVPDPGSWCLLGCTVSPGFEFSGFELIGDEGVVGLTDTHPTHEALIRRLG